METLELTTKDTAKLIRKELKNAFAGIKFSVTCDNYAGGSSIWVTYAKATGITLGAVHAVVDKFESKKFDGSTDSTVYVTSEIDGVPVKFGNHFLFVDAS